MVKTGRDVVVTNCCTVKEDRAHRDGHCVEKDCPRLGTGGTAARGVLKVRAFVRILDLKSSDGVTDAETLEQQESMSLHGLAFPDAICAPRS